MNPAEYQDLARRTECDQEAASRRRLFIDNEQGTKLRATRLNHAVLGLSGEVGELAAAVEHVIHYGQPWDVININEEIGDCLWYIALACNAMGFNLEQVMESNIAKLQSRYPEKYADNLAAEQNRDREAERRVINNGGYTASDAFRSKPADDNRPSLTLDYDRYCSECNRNPIHKTSTASVCPDCFASKYKNNPPRHF